ncbi:hypothetical protein AAY473_010977 [Plecturocebus cupreus]
MNSLTQVTLSLPMEQDLKNLRFISAASTAQLLRIYKGASGGNVEHESGQGWWSLEHSTTERAPSPIPGAKEAKDLGTLDGNWKQLWDAPAALLLPPRYVFGDQRGSEPLHPARLWIYVSRGWDDEMQPGQGTQQRQAATRWSLTLSLKLECSGAISAHCSLRLVNSNTGFHHVGQAGFELLTLGDQPTLASQSAGITGLSRSTQPTWNIFFKADTDFTIDQAGLELLTSLSTHLGLPKCWDYRREPLHPAD